MNVFFRRIVSIVGERVRDVFAHGAAEQRGLLRNDANRSAQIVERELPDVMTINDAIVVFPAPLGPTSATTSPGAMRSDTSLNTSGDDAP